MKSTWAHKKPTSALMMSAKTLIYQIIQFEKAGRKEDAERCRVIRAACIEELAKRGKKIL